jgi:hypothetical protein
MRIATFVLVGLLANVAITHAEIEKLAIPGNKGLRLLWWPKLPDVLGWYHDREHSVYYGFNALSPDGFTFANAETVIYARAIYKPRDPDTKSLEMLIEKDKKTFLANSPGMAIQEVASVSTADGKKMRSFTFFPKGKGNWERVSYAEEGEFYLIFTVSSRSMAGYKAAASAYERLIGLYKEKP